MEQKAPHLQVTTKMSRSATNVQYREEVNVISVFFFSGLSKVGFYMLLFYVFCIKYTFAAVC